MALAALSEILAAARFDAPAMAAIKGEDPVLPVRYRIGTAGAASLAALGLAVEELWELRGGARQRVDVDLRAAAVSLRSARYLRVNGKPPPPPWDPLSGFYPVREGWISIHCNFRNHREAAMGVLGATTREAGEQASRGWQGEALEDAIHVAGGCAGFVRSHAHWARHAQALAVATQPLIEIERIGDAPAEPLPEAPRPLAGVRVLDLTRVLAGPTCARSLAEHGADVLKISAGHLPDSGMMDLDTGIGKLSARIDLREPEGVAKLQALARDAHVFSQSYRPGALARRGFAPEDLAALRPGIVCVSLSAWGGSGPWRERRGFDSIVQSVSGIAHAHGDGMKPRLLPVSAIDYVSGYLMAFGATVALARRAREGGSWLVRVALARVGKFIVDLGEPRQPWAGLPEELPEAELAALMGEMDAPEGRIRFLKPVIQLSQTPPHWTRPPVPLGTH
ncbi:MAG: coA-transferase family protein, partial [Burkholderiales bacterium]|nr:coA-transferase family protein [Burkholderiales bacterium]